MPFEIRNVQIQPDGRTKIKLMADFVQRVKNFMGPGIIAAVLDTNILQHMIILKYFSPQTKHGKSPYKLIIKKWWYKGFFAYRL